MYKSFPELEIKDLIKDRQTDIGHKDNESCCKNAEKKGSNTQLDVTDSNSVIVSAERHLYSVTHSVSKQRWFNHLEKEKNYKWGRKTVLARRKLPFLLRLNKGQWPVNVIIEEQIVKV